MESNPYDIALRNSFISRVYKITMKDGEVYVGVPVTGSMVDAIDAHNPRILIKLKDKILEVKNNDIENMELQN